MVNHQLTIEEKIELKTEKKANARNKRQRQKMKVSGKGVFELKKIISKK